MSRREVVSGSFVGATNEPSLGGFIREESLDVLLRTGQVIGGIGQILLGGAICSGGPTCALGGVLAAKGLDNAQAGLRRTDSVAQQILVDATGSEQAGGLINAGLDLGTSVGGLVRGVPKIGSLGLPVRPLFNPQPSVLEPAFRQATTTGLTAEGLTSTATIYDAVRQ